MSADRQEARSAAQDRPVEPKRTSWGVKLSRKGIFIGCPRLLDITWYGGRLTFRTYNHFLRVWPFGYGRSAW